jgi:hypothetical protein
MIGDSMSGGFMTTSPDTMRHVLYSKFWSNWMIGRYGSVKIGEGGSITFTSGTGGHPQDISVVRGKRQDQGVQLLRQRQRYARTNGHTA